MNPALVEELKSILPHAMLADWVHLGARLVRLLKDHRHSSRHDEVLRRLIERAQASRERRALRQATPLKPTYPDGLPIAARKDEIVAAIRAHPVVVISGETGSGKTTQLPKMCLEAGLGVEALIGCTQPRRVAALSISRRIAEELGVEWGREVGCKIRFDDRSNEWTRIKLMTDGILLAEAQSDPQLSEYNAIIIDEAHERSLNIDFLLGLLNRLSLRRKDLKIIITSATIDTAAFAQAFGGAPIIEVSGRMYPVEVKHAPPPVGDEDEGELDVAEAACLAVERMVIESASGDILIFMPGEREIKETKDLLESRLGGSLEVIPLFARLSAGEQERAFLPSPRRKVIVATNIAETSLTLPGIKFVVDSGLARLSRYNPKTRTQRLPIEPISRSSANQRKGRAGRVQEGVCIRLYPQEDFDARPEHTQPEIQRSNLAEVILRMKVFALGEIETFPLLDPPSPSAIDGGYKLLQELGALDENRALTSLGQKLGRLPIDPTLGRMLLQSLEEGAVRETLIIASGLSVQDPRERPMAQKDAAEAAHRRSSDSRSDFLSLLHLWKKIDEQWNLTRTQRERRKFCKAHFLSYTRVVEWRDLHFQLLDGLREHSNVPEAGAPAGYDAIHKCVLAGFAGQVARRLEKNRYKTAGGKESVLFPGSGLYERPLPQTRSSPKSSGSGHPVKSKQPEWIVAAEIVETSQLFARTAGAISPEWLLEVAPHLCRATHANPHWSPEAGKVLAEEVIWLNGLELIRRKVAYETIAPEEARDLFIRRALVEEEWEPPRTERERRALTGPRNPTQNQLLAASGDQEHRPTPMMAFLDHNRALRHKIETWQTRVRRHDLGDMDEMLYQFYRSRIPLVSSRHAFLKWLREEKSDERLFAAVTDLSGGLELGFDEHAFPEQVSIDGEQVRVSYAYAPGESHDGATLSIPASLAPAMSGAQLSWAIPGQRIKIAGEYLRALPKAIRKELMPLAPKAEDIAREMQATGGTLAADLARFIQRKYGMHIPESAWNPSEIAEHLRTRAEIIDAAGKVLGCGRDWGELQKAASQIPARATSRTGVADPWPSAVERFEKYDLRGWTIGDLPPSLDVGISQGCPLKAWPGLEWEQGAISLRMYRTESLARAATQRALPAFLEMEIRKDLAWARQDLRSLEKFRTSLEGWMPVDAFQEEAWNWLRRHATARHSLPLLRERDFLEAAANARSRLRADIPELLRLLAEILRARGEVLTTFSRLAGAQPSGKASKVLTSLGQLNLESARTLARHPLRGELDDLLPADFLRQSRREDLQHLPRWLRALQMRADRAALHPAKDAERLKLLAPWTLALAKAEASSKDQPELERVVEEFRFMVREYRVSLFAQELGTSVPVSPKRLQELCGLLFRP